MLELNVLYLIAIVVGVVVVAGSSSSSNSGSSSSSSSSRRRHRRRRRRRLGSGVMVSGSGSGSGSSSRLVAELLVMSAVESVALGSLNKSLRRPLLWRPQVKKPRNDAVRMLGNDEELSSGVVATT